MNLRVLKICPLVLKSSILLLQSLGFLRGKMNWQNLPIDSRRTYFVEEINCEMSSYFCCLLRKTELYFSILHSNVSSMEDFLFVLPKEYSWLTLLLILMTKLSPTCFLIVSSAVTIVSAKTWKLFLLRTKLVLTSYHCLCSRTFAFCEMTWKR